MGKYEGAKVNDLFVTQIDPARGSGLKVFLGPDSAYFAVDGKFITPITIVQD